MNPERTVRKTSQRNVILEELCRDHSHPTAHELYERVRRRMPRISLGTVYRNLEVLSALGVIRKLELTGSEKRFDFNTDTHYHMRCTRCGALEDVRLKPGVHFSSLITEDRGYEIHGARLELYGLCGPCRGLQEPQRSGESGSPP